MAIDGQNVTLYAGDDATLNFTITNEANNAQPLNACVFVYTISYDEGYPPVVTKTSISGISVTNAIGGLLSVALGHADTASLQGAMWHQLVMTDGVGNVSTLTTGTITFKVRS